MIESVGTSQNINSNMKTGVGRGGSSPVSSERALSLPGKGIADGALVEGSVKGEGEGGYLVRIGNQTMTARSTLPLFVGQRFQAIWDSSGNVPLLRLRPEDAALVGRFSGLDKDVASMLLAKGLPINDEVIYRLRKELRRLGGGLGSLNSMVELLARGEKLSSENVSLISWYTGLSSDEATALWKKIRKSFRESTFRGEDPLDVMKKLRDGDDEVAHFLRGHALISRPPSDGLGGSALSSAWWPVDDDDQMSAKVSFSVTSGEEKAFHLVNFDMEGETLGPVKGRLESDGNSLIVALEVLSDESRQLLQRELESLRSDLNNVGLPLQYVGVESSRENLERLYRHLDLEA